MPINGKGLGSSGNIDSTLLCGRGRRIYLGDEGISHAINFLLQLFDIILFLTNNEKKSM